MESESFRAARRHVERKVGFYIHLAAYVTVNSGLALVNLMTASGRPWVLGPLLGWGLGLSFHGLAVFLQGPGRTWKSRMMEKELRKLREPRKIEGQP